MFLSCIVVLFLFFLLFFFNDPAPTEIYTLPLHDALPILPGGPVQVAGRVEQQAVLASRPVGAIEGRDAGEDRKSTRLNSSHLGISYAVFCLKKKKKKHKQKNKTK